jgi:uncharacterized membrane protein YoaK (UPF0700 family)
MNRARAVTSVGGMFAFNGGCVDATGFLGLHGLFAAHVTGNLATLCAAIVLGSHGLIGKLLAVPEFIAVIAFARLAGLAMKARRWPARNLLLATETLLLIAFFALALGFGPFANFDSLPALVTGFVAIAAMAVQNEMQIVHLPAVAPTTFMTGNAADVAVELAALLAGDKPSRNACRHPGIGNEGINLGCFSVGCAISALLYWRIGFWCLVVPVAVAVVIAFLPLDRAGHSS